MSMHTNSAEGNPVSLQASENTFLVTGAETKKVVSNDSTVGKTNPVLPQEVFDRDVLLDVFDIDSDDVHGVNIAGGSYDLWRKYLNSPQISAYCNSFGMIACDLIVTVRIIVPGSCFGLYCVQCLSEGGTVPLSTTFEYEFDGSAEDDWRTSTQDEHGFLNIELRNALVFHLPWQHYQDSVVINTADPIMCWRLLIWCLCPMQNTVNPAQANGKIQVYARMGEKRSFQNLRFQGYGDASRHPVPAKSTSSYFSTPLILNMARPVSSGLAALSSVADALGFTRESVPQLPVSQVWRAFSNLANYDGEDSSDVVALSVANSLTIDSSFGGGVPEDIMSFSSLFKRWTILRAIPLTTSTSGYFATIPVSPFTYNVDGGDEVMSIGGVLGLPFARWRGGMEYMIYIASTSNIQGSLQVVWTPTYTADLPVGDPTNRLSNVIIDLSGTSKTCIRVNYAMPTPSLGSMMWPVGTTNCWTNTVNGYLRFYMNAPMTAPREGSYTLHVLVLHRPAQDMRFGIPTTKIYKNGSEFPMSSVRYQGEDDEVPCEFVELTSNSGDYPVEELLFGETVASCRALVQHFSPVATTAGSGVGEISSRWGLVVPHYWPSPSTYYTVSPFQYQLNSTPQGPVDTNTVPTFSYVGFYTAFFTGIRGSTRWKLDTRTADNIIMFPIPPTASLGSLELFDTEYFTLSHGVMGLQPTNGGGVEFCIPAYSSNKYVLRRFLNSWNSPHNGNRMDVIITGDSATNIIGNLFTAAGPDFTVTRFRRVPRMTVLAV